MVSGYMTVRNILWLSVCFNLTLISIVLYSRQYGGGHEQSLAEYEALMSRFLVMQDQPELNASSTVSKAPNDSLLAATAASDKYSSLQICTTDKIRQFQLDKNAKKVHMFIAIGSKGSLLSRRQEIRRTWLNWIPKDGSIEYMFFTDHGNDPIAIANAKKEGRYLLFKL